MPPPKSLVAADAWCQWIYRPVVLEPVRFLRRVPSVGIWASSSYYSLVSTSPSIYGQHGKSPLLNDGYLSKSRGCFECKFANGPTLRRWLHDVVFRKFALVIYGRVRDTMLCCQSRARSFKAIQWDVKGKRITLCVLVLSRVENNKLLRSQSNFSGYEFPWNFRGWGEWPWTVSLCDVHHNRNIVVKLDQRKMWRWYRLSAAPETCNCSFE